MIKNKNNRFILTVSKSRWAAIFFSVIVLAVLFEPAYITDLSGGLHRIYRILKYVAAVSVLAVFVLRHGKLNTLLLGTIIFEGCLLISTLVRGGDLYIWTRSGAYCVVLMLFAQMVVSKVPDILFKAGTIILGLYVHINTLTWILYPNGLFKTAVGYENCWFLGYDNCAAAIVLLAEIMALYHIVSTHKRLKLWDWSILISGSIFIFGSMIATAIIAEVVAILFLLLTWRETVRKIIGSAKLVVIGMLALFLLIQFFSVQESSVFVWIFLLLGKNATFTGRTRIWKIAWKDLFPHNIVLGMGMQESAKYAAHFGARVFTHLHSYYMQVLYDGGLLAFGSFMFLLLDVARRFDQGKKDFSDMVLLAGLLSFMVMWQAEAYSQLIIYFFVLLALLYNAPMLKQPQDREQRQKLCQLIR